MLFTRRDKLPKKRHTITTPCAAHLVWVVLKDIDQQVVVQVAELGELKKFRGHQREQNI